MKGVLDFEMRNSETKILVQHVVIYFEGPNNQFFSRMFGESYLGVNSKRFESLAAVFRNGQAESFGVNWG